MSRPTTSPPTWATSGSATKTEPSVGRKTGGWKFKDIPPFDEWNWWMNLVGLWLTWLKDAYPVFVTPEDAWENLGDGEVGYVDENDHGAQPGSLADLFATNQPTSALAADGVSVFYSVSASPNPRQVLRNATGTIVKTFTKSNGGGVTKLVVAPGGYLYAAYSTHVDCWRVANGTLVWTHNSGGTVYDICYYAGKLFIASSSGAQQLVCVAYDTGAPQWTYDHGATLAAVGCRGNTVIVGGSPSAHASSATLRAININNGYDAAGEGGLGVDGGSQCWDIVTTDPVQSQGLWADRHGIYVAQNGGNLLEKHDVVTGAATQSYTFPAAGDIQRVAGDHEYVYVAYADGGFLTGSIWCFEKVSLQPKWRLQDNNDPFIDVVSDGCAVWAAKSTTSAGDEAVRRIVRGNRPHLFRRSQGGADWYEPNAGAITPEEG